jgi:hypothetical protein
MAKRRNSSVKIPVAIGAVLDLGNCFDLLDYQNLEMLHRTYQNTNPMLRLLQNRSIERGNSDELLLRYLDCAVIEEFHRLRRVENKPPFDSVRTVFWEGKPLYPNAGFREKNHIQICIRNPNCIKGLFLPRFN